MPPADPNSAAFMVGIAGSVIASGAIGLATWCLQQTVILKTKIAALEATMQSRESEINRRFGELKEWMRDIDKKMDTLISREGGHR